MPGGHSLQITSSRRRAQPTLEQERFNFLLRQIEKVRKERTALETIIFKFQQNHTERLASLRASLTEVCKETAFTLDRLIDQPGWSRADLAALREILCGTVEALIEANGADATLTALYDKHSGTNFAAAKEAEFQRLKAEAEAMTGLDLGEDEGILSEEDLVQRMYEELAAREAAQAARENAKAQRRRKSAAEQRSEDNARSARQSVREIYRKLASAVHPDREPDPVRRKEKNALMQKINQAYAANDLLTLFEAQLQIEQIDPDHITTLSAQRLKQYNKLLAEQLAREEALTEEMERSFCARYDVELGAGVSARRLNTLLQRQASRLRGEIERQRQFLNVLATKTATRQWLRQQRRFAAYRDDLDDL